MHPHLEVSPLPAPLALQLKQSIASAERQWLGQPGALMEADEILQRLERVVLFLRQNGSPSRQAGQVAALAFLFGEWLVRQQGFSWCCAQLDGATTPAVLSFDCTTVCSVVDVVTQLVMHQNQLSFKQAIFACAARDVSNFDGVYRLKTPV